MDVMINYGTYERLSLSKGPFHSIQQLFMKKK